MIDCTINQHSNTGRCTAPQSTGLRQNRPLEVNSEQLFAGARELLIRHGGERYTLRQTSKGKLILTK